MTDYDMTAYDENKLSINQYIELLAEFNKKLTNIKNNHIPIETRKHKAFDFLLKQVVKLEGDELELWKDKLENLFNPKKSNKVEKVNNDLSKFNIGEDVLIYTKYKIDEEDYSYETYVKCKIHKINKCSITLQKYKCNADFSSYNRAAREQTFGRLYFNWTNELQQNKIVIKDVSKILRSDWDLYDTFIKQSDYFVDFGH
jgi:hypothetical protein